MSSSKKILDSFERSKILEIYFLRIEGRSPASTLNKYEPLFSIELKEIKNYLLCHESKDSMLSKVLNITDRA